MRIRYGMVGGGPGAFIGAVHRMAAALDGEYELVAGAFDVDPALSKQQGAELGLDPVDVLDDGAGEFRSVRSPIRMSATPPTVRRRPPTNDQHGAEIRAELDS